MTDISNLPAQLFSPFKCVYVAYVVLAAYGKIEISGFWEFFLVSLAIMALEILHNDWLRIKLNRKAKSTKTSESQ